MNVKNLEGLKFERLFVLKLLDDRNHGHAAYLCLCDCGNSIEVNGNSLKRGNTKSCGCLKKERIIEHNIQATIHGGYKHPLYNTWTSMRSRCNNPNHPSFKDYGGRNIKIDSSWDDFQQFLQDMGPKPSSEYSLERINVDGNYEPSNCKWATRIEQAQNKRPEIRNVKTEKDVVRIFEKLEEVLHPLGKSLIAYIVDV